MTSGEAMKRKPLFKPKDPFEREIEAMKQRISGRHKPALDFAKAREILVQKQCENQPKSL